MLYQVKLRAEITEVQTEPNGYQRVNFNNSLVIEEMKMLGELDFEGLTRVLAHLHAAMAATGE